MRDKKRAGLDSGEAWRAERNRIAEATHVAEDSSRTEKGQVTDQSQQNARALVLFQSATNVQDVLSGTR